MDEADREGRLIAVSNRLPIVITREEGDGDWRLDPGSGGLVTAMVPVLEDRGGIWIGWPGAAEDEIPDLPGFVAERTAEWPYRVEPVLLTREEEEQFYLGFSNQVIWPLFHDLQSHCNFDPEFWLAYERVNRKFAEAIARIGRTRDFVWVHDYHLMSVARELRELEVEAALGFFLHTPFPPLDLFVKLPWRSQILDSLLKFDLVGFQTARDRRNFIQCVRALRRDVAVTGGERVLEARVAERRTRIGVFPISIDFDAFARDAAADAVTEEAEHVRTHLPDRQLILGVDRLDYTKGVPNKLRAFRRALERFRYLRGNVTLVQLVVPSREDIPKYHELKVEIDRLVGEINGEFTHSGWVPIHYVYRSWERTELLAYYRISDVALVTPLKDGMNLVSKEYCACSLDEDGVLILSEFAGSSAQLQRDAILVNPYDIEQVAEAVNRAVTMPPEERERRMRSLRKTVKETDIYWWVRTFLQAATGVGEEELPPVEAYPPYTAT